MTESRREAAPLQPPRSETSEILLQQHARYDYSSPVTNLRQRLILVPRATHGAQRRSRWRLAVEGVDGFRVTARRDPFGNLTVAVVIPRVESWVQFSVETKVCTAAGIGPHRARPDRRYLSPTRLTAPDERIAALAEGQADAAALSARVHAALTYEWGITGVHTTAAEALAGGRGVCQDYAHVMISACRVAGLQARYVSGHLLGEGGSHAWVEVLTPDPRRANSWLVEAWDPTHDRRAGAGYIAVAVGRDYADVAPVSGTFDGEGVMSALATRKQVVLAA